MNLANTMTILQTAINAIFPIVLIIALGYMLRQSGFLTEEFVSLGGKLGFSVCLPCSLFNNVYSVESASSIQWDLVIYSVTMMFVLFFLGLLTNGFVTKDRKRRGVVLQCVFRSNIAIVGLPLSYALGGEEAAVITTVLIAFTLPLLNIGGVTALSIYVGDDNQKVDIKKILYNIAKNPLIHAILLGLLCLAARSLQQEFLGQVAFSLKRDIPFLYTAIKNVGSIASPFMLLILGAQFDFSACKGMAKEIIAGTLWRVVLAPLLVIGAAVLLTNHTQLLHCSSASYPALIALFGSPTAVSGGVMAQQMGNDAQLATQLVVWTSIGSIITMFLTVCILMSTGLLVV